jgi:hypothetical protein
MQKKESKNQTILTNLRHKAFADEYLSNGMIGGKAYSSVYKSVKSEATADASASRLLSNDKIKAYIAEQQAQSAKTLRVSREEIIADLKQIKDSFKGADKYPPHAMKAIEILNKMLGYNEPDKTEVEHKGIIFNIIKPDEK